ncbi:MAG: hypothetical protein E7057_05615 [Lentisphaerae bacterium]|nr:hypothetical protein [Lentisphaerota bacterium]
MKRFLLAITVLGAAGVFAAESVYLCRKCRILTVKENTPSYPNCGKGGNHLWFKAAVHGDNIFHCRKCALLIYSKGTPSYSYCIFRRQSLLVQARCQGQRTPFMPQVQFAGAFFRTAGIFRMQKQFQSQLAETLRKAERL